LVRVDTKRSNQFKREIKHIKDKKLKQRIKKAIKEIIKNPEKAGKPLKYRKGFKVKIPPFRIIYKYDKKNDVLEFVKFGHRDKIYKKK